MISPILYVAETGAKGRGVFALAEIGAEVIIEDSPVIVMTASDRKLLDQTLLHDYIFEWQPDDADMCCMALGWLPLYNHSDTPNCEYFMDYEHQTIFVKTLREIEANGELTFNYNGSGDVPSVLWFEVKE